MKMKLLAGFLVGALAGHLRADGIEPCGGAAGLREEAMRRFTAVFTSAAASAISR